MNPYNIIDEGESEEDTMVAGATDVQLEFKQTRAFLLVHAI